MREPLEHGSNCGYRAMASGSEALQRITLRPKPEDVTLSSIVIPRVRRQLEQLLPEDDELWSSGMDARLEKIVGGVGEEGILHIAKLFKRHDSNADGRLDAWEIEQAIGELSGFVPADKIRSVLIPDYKACGLSFFEFAERFAAVRDASPGAMRLPGQRWKVAAPPPAITSDKAIVDEALAAMGRYGTAEGRLDLLNFRNMVSTLDSTYGWEHRLGHVLALFRRHDTQRLGKLDIDAVIGVLRELHGVSDGENNVITNGEEEHITDTLAVGSTMASTANHRNIQRPVANMPTAMVAKCVAAGEVTQSSKPAQLERSLVPVHQGQTNSSPPPPPQPSTPVPPSMQHRDSSYMDTLLTRAQSSMAVRDALGTLPQAEMQLIFDEFKRCDKQLTGLLNEEQFLSLWHSLR